MFTSSQLYYPTFGPSASGPFTINMPGACVTQGVSFVADGFFTGNFLGNFCEHATGAGTANGHHPFTMTIAGPTITFTGSVQGTLQMHPDVTGGESCMTGADRFLVSGSVTLTGATAWCAGAGTMATSHQLYYPTLGPSATGTFTINMPGACVTGGAGFTANGSFTSNAFGNYCGFATGSGVANGTNAFDMTVVGTTITFTGGVQGTLHMVPEATSGQSCTSGATRFVVFGSVVLV